MAQVQICLRPIVCDKDLSMLIGTHRSRVHIDIGIKFLVAHSDTPLLQKLPRDAAQIPFPRPDTTPPVMNTNFVDIILPSSYKNTIFRCNDRISGPKTRKSPAGLLLRLKVPVFFGTFSCDPRACLFDFRACGLHRKSLLKVFQKYFPTITLRFFLVNAPFPSGPNFLAALGEVGKPLWNYGSSPPPILIARGQSSPSDFVKNAG